MDRIQKGDKMKEFKDFKIAIQEQFDKMIKGLLSNDILFVTDIDKHKLWEMYLISFPEGTNKQYKERNEYDCQSCKQFIRTYGNIVSIVDNKLVSIWDINTDSKDLLIEYKTVAESMSEFVKSASIKNIFLNKEKKCGNDFNIQLTDESTIRWDHFYLELPSKFVEKKDSIDTIKSDKRTNKEVFKKGLEEITLEAAETVLELIEQNSIYRGEEHKRTVELFIKLKKEFIKLIDIEKDNYCWNKSMNLGSVSRIKNTVIGTLLVDVSNEIPLDDAVRMFESKVAPTNYKRPSALVTKGMIDKAQKKVESLGIEDSLNRRYAVTEDITINNVIWADRSVKKIMNVFDEMAAETPENIKSFEKVMGVDMELFVATILPKADSIEFLFENKHVNNMISLIAPINKNSKNIFKWDNNFSWAYKGEVADSMKERVKRASGNVTGVLRFSIQWNDDDNNQNDFDAHCIEPDKNLISYPKAGQIQLSSGMLDVDIINPGKNIAVENITWIDKNKIQEGKYKFLVHNYNHCGGKTGFTAEIEYDGQIYSYSYDKELRHNEKVTVAEIEFSKANGIKFIKSLPSTSVSKEVWGITTNSFHKVSMIMNSPNHWDGNKTGNKHYFFMLENCKNEEKARGFFNEFLNEELREYRKVFEILGSKMKTEKSENQLSGLGFSSTQKNSIFCKVSGNFSRTIKINF